MKREVKLQIQSCRECPALSYISTTDHIEYWCSASDAKTGRQDYEIDCLKHLDRMFENCTVWEKVK